MKLFICNSTRQKWHASFRVPESRKPYFVEVPPGAQVQVDPNLGQDWLNAIIEHIERYGGKEASKVSGKLSEFSGYFYRWEKPVAIDDIYVGHEAVNENAQERAAGAAVNTAMAFDMSKRDKTGQRLATETEIDVTEQVKPGQKPSGKEIKSKITISPEGSTNVKLPRA